jgi:AcrR family transcriptional regulator
MPKTKSFTRDAVLQKAIPVFLKKGYADTSIQDLEKATGINKSSLYSEFESKEGVYAACIDHFADYKSAKNTLLQTPFGWSNIEAFLLFLSEYKKPGENGCLLVYSMREHHSLPPVLKAQNEEYLEKLQKLLVKNISAEKTSAPAEVIAPIIMNLFGGAALMQNVGGLEKGDRSLSIETMMQMLRSM